MCEKVWNVKIVCWSCHKNIFFEHLFMDSVLSNSIASCDVRVYKKSGKIMGNNFKQQQYFKVLCPPQSVKIFSGHQFTFSSKLSIRYLWNIFICKSSKTEQKSKKHLVITQIMQKKYQYSYRKYFNTLWHFYCFTWESLLSLKFWTGCKFNCDTLTLKLNWVVGSIYFGLRDR